VRARTCALAAAILAGCATPPPAPPPRSSERIVLLPSQSDRPSALVVSAGGADLLLDKPYASADLRAGMLNADATSAAQVQARYGELLSAQPPQPRNFTIYFQLGTDELTPASRKAFEDARREIAAWPGVEVVVIGHTDRVGSVELNDKLSRQRAQTVASRLVEAGVAARAIEIVSRGEREPLIATADEVPEPRNRRVVIKVR
jgi:outer membrane protein OmpA-like peptidoglycan-associated protein